MLTRILEPELMDTPEDAHEYDTMEHSVVNTQFVDDLLRTVMEFSCPPLTRLLDLGAGTSQILIELANRYPAAHVTAVDAAQEMLALARRNIAAAQAVPLPCREGPGEGSRNASLSDRIELVFADAKQLPYADESFQAVLSNSIVHHIPEPQIVLAEAVRVTSAGGLLFHRDLARPNDEAQLKYLVETYAGTSTEYQRKLFAESLRAALTIDEVGDLVAALGFPRDTVRMTSDRHWTWTETKT